ncbi:MAG: hypothetical protein PUE61_01365 [Clostridiales bacterium]|nr:hypothetical protein [Clostridiales bacterium]
MQRVFPGNPCAYGGGIRTAERIRNNEQLLEILRAEKYQPVCEAHLPEEER